MRLFSDTWFALPPVQSTEFVCAYNGQYETDYFNTLSIAGKLNSALGENHHPGEATADRCISS